MPLPAPVSSPPSIDHPDMRHAGADLLSLALMDARNHTLNLLAQWEEGMSASGSQLPQREELELPAWLGGHIAWLAEYWIARNPRRHAGPACPPDAVRLASIEPMADGWFNPLLAPHAARWAMELPDLQGVRAFLLETLESTLELLEKAPAEDDGLYFYRMALFHEDLRGEQMLAMAQSLGLPMKLPLPQGHQSREPVLVPAGRWQLGAPAEGFAFDIERGVQEVQVPEFEIDAQPVTWSQYVEFVDDGGYDRQELWLPEGWVWLQAQARHEGRRGPRYVDQIGVASGAVMRAHFGKPARMAGSQSAMHVSWWEADAWARWAGRRLPSELEWEMAAHSAARRGFRWGDVREWTANLLRPWPGFVPDAWSRHSDLEAPPQFGHARVLRGASYATRARMKHPKWRGFALPHRDDGFVGFRSCAI